jgi:hypothetical protein
MYPLGSQKIIVILGGKHEVVADTLRHGFRRSSICRPVHEMQRIELIIIIMKMLIEGFIKIAADDDIRKLAIRIR